MVQRRLLTLLTAAVVAGFCASCARSAPPAPVTNLGMTPESAHGAVIVMPGDTLWNVSQRYRLPMRDIIELNNLTPPYSLPLSMRLRLPAPVDYRVKAGDSVQSIASTFGVAASQLVQVNGLSAPYTLSVGQVLRIPSSRRAVGHSPVIAAKSAPKAVVASEALPPATSVPVKKQDAAGDKKTPPLTPPKKTRVIETPVQTTLAAPTRKDFVWPLRGKVISGYGAKDGGLVNEGINIAAPRGAPVVAATGGTVAYVGNELKSYGNLILIRHSGGVMTAYAHMGTVGVKKGDVVNKGQVIGAVGSSGTVDTPQLHFEVRQGKKTVDPQKYL